MYPRISQGRRALGITIDWLAAYAVSLGFFAGSGTLLERSRGIGGTVLLEDCVEDGIGELVTEFVGVTRGDGFGGEIAEAHGTHFCRLTRERMR